MPKASTNRKCSVCFTTNTPVWRRNVNHDIICNACRLYELKYSRQRPIRLQIRKDSQLSNFTLIMAPEMKRNIVKRSELLSPKIKFMPQAFPCKSHLPLPSFKQLLRFIEPERMVY